MKINRCVRDEARNSIRIETKKGNIYLFAVKPNIIRCVYSLKEYEDVSPLEIEPSTECEIKIDENQTEFLLSTDQILLVIDKETGTFCWKEKTGKILLHEGGKELTETPLIQYTTGGKAPEIRRVVTVDGERNFVENLKPEQVGVTYQSRLYFDFAEDEKIHGLGQGEEGIYDYRGQTQYLYQHNMRIPIPFFVSNKGYGILFDCGSVMTFQDDVRGSYMYLDAVKQLDYYFIAGRSMDACIAGYRTLTGQAAMLPKWSFGYVQSKEAYHDQKEFVDVAKQYRDRKIPLDCIVQDWKTWEPGKWGNKRVDKTRFPNLKEMNEQLHHMNVHSMVSVWPNMNTGTEDHDEMTAAGHMLYDFATYDAFDEEARKCYWNQLNRELFSGGYDSWWCDSTEPFSGPDWGGENMREPWKRFSMVGEEHKKYLGMEEANLFALKHAQGVFENQRKESEEKRVLNLTRSGYASCQKYGVVLWSGDICARWDVLKKQIAEGLNMCMSGIPYWTLDIGGFFVVHEDWQKRGCDCNEDPSPKWFWRGDYENGVEDPAYRELYVRWLEFGAFLPIFRSHGTDTPREIWNFGEPGEIYYDAIEKTIQLRYRLMPYIYSLAGAVRLEHDTMMRSLLFDFPDDKVAAECDTEFMFGRNLLICPITEPMNGKTEWSCYLPKGNRWYDFYTNQLYEGGQTILVEAPMDRIPVFAKEGSIIPMESGLQYAQEEVDTPLEIHVYPGKDATLHLYEDAGNQYDYEKGIYNDILLSWNDKEKKLSVGDSQYTFAQGIANRKCVLIVGDEKIEL